MVRDDPVTPTATPVQQLQRTAAGARLADRPNAPVARGGQNHNSSPSGEQYLTAVCEHAAEMDVQTLLVGITWSSRKPVEGTDDFEGGTWRPGRVLNDDEWLYLVPPGDVGAVQIRLLRTDAA